MLCGLFWMASMLAYAFYVRRRPLFQSSPQEAVGTLGIYLLVTLFFGLALLAKSMAVTLPCVFLLLDAWPLDRWRRALWPPGRRAGVGPDFLSASRLLIEKLPWFAMVVYDCQQTVVGQDKGVALEFVGGTALGPRIANALISIAAYLGQMFWPAGMAPFYPHPSHVSKAAGRGPLDQLAARWRYRPCWYSRSLFFVSGGRATWQSAGSGFWVR